MLDMVLSILYLLSRTALKQQSRMNYIIIFFILQLENLQI